MHTASQRLAAHLSVYGSGCVFTGLKPGVNDRFYNAKLDHRVLGTNLDESRQNGQNVEKLNREVIYA